MMVIFFSFKDISKTTPQTIKHLMYTIQATKFYLHLQGLRPRRTLRAVLWTGEEQGGVGAQQYFNLHKVLLLCT